MRLASLLVGILASFTAIATPIADKVLVPGSGFWTKTNIHEILAGGSLSRVGSEIHVLAANGTIVHSTTVGLPAKVKSEFSREETGWITFAFWLNTGSSPISSFTTTWTVPPVPTENHSQTIFLFNSIQPTDSAAILQPVLQYGPSAAGGGAFWAVATWYVGPSNTFFTTPVPVAPGDTLNGIITLLSSNGSSFSYNSQFTNIPRTSLTVNGISELKWATETLEAYAVTSASDYPAGSTVFSGINLELEDGTAPNVSWSPVNDDADGLSTTINTDGATNAAMTIKY
ncbi:hypothetical protein C8J56DRAFT_389360 [Mycena floridula]|nr:hypothetical protein C8J56DRAFT_389360 [Mycena floridula]